VSNFRHFARTAAFSAVLSLTLLTNASPVVAQSGFVDPMPRWALAGAFGTPRLYLKSLLADRPRGAAQAVTRTASSLALGQNVKYGQPNFSFGLRPLLVYDNNINGGLPFDVIDLGAFRFTVSENTRAREALTLGARASVALDIPVAQGLMLNGFAQIGRRYSPEFDTNITDRSAGLCLRYTADTWTYADGCLSKGDLDNERNTATSRTRSLSIGHLFENASATHELSVTVIQQSNNGSDQNRIRIGSRSMLNAFGAVDAGVTFGEKIEGSLKQTFAADLGYGAIVFGKPTRLSVSYAEEKGGNLFGQTRSENTVTIRASRTVVKNVMAYVSHKTTKSSIAEFSNQSWGFGLEYSGFRW
jgi:hypothetical protein